MKLICDFDAIAFPLAAFVLFHNLSHNSAWLFKPYDTRTTPKEF